MSQPDSSEKPLFDALAANYETSTGGCAREIATHIVDILPPVDANSVVLDNACGTGIFSQELFFKYPDTPLFLTCVDIAKNMIDIARSSVPAGTSAATVSFDVMPGEKLSFPDETFSHSITTLGIFFFKDAAAGAREIYRTLKPGGTAIVTSWKVMGHLDVVYAAQMVVKPQGPWYQWPVSDDWHKASHLPDTLKNAGFKNVEVHEVTSTYGSSSVEETCSYLMDLWNKVGPDWTAEENAEFEKQLLVAGKKMAVTAKRPRNGKKGAEIVEVVGFPMVACVAVAKK